MAPSIFISYSHQDSTYAHRLADVLEQQGFSVWIDGRIDYGSEWPQEIQKHLDSCKAFIVIMTPRSLDSGWVQNELARAGRKKKKIYPLWLEGDDVWLSVERLQYVDVRNGDLPPSHFFTQLIKALPKVPRKTKDKQQTRTAPKPKPAQDKPKSKPDEEIHGESKTGYSEDAFAELIGGSRKGKDIRINLSVTLEDVEKEKTKTLRYKRLSLCGTCAGTGEHPIVIDIFAGSGAAGPPIGKQPPRCATCSGEGRREAERTVKVKIPPTALPGTSLRLQGEGDAGIRKGEPGDLFVTIKEIT